MHSLFDSLQIVGDLDIAMMAWLPVGASYTCGFVGSFGGRAVPTPTPRDFTGSHVCGVGVTPRGSISGAPASHDCLFMMDNQSLPDGLAFMLDA